MFLWHNIHAFGGSKPLFKGIKQVISSCYPAFFIVKCYLSDK
ncbi:hypothetical protein KIS4809_3521 [Bacillus sp. ZZV12-4809]|nr:hypothetical protein KIS4809_3521 [Bacillus sp. ZZV12-4809]